MAQYIMVVQVLVAAAQTIQALGDQIAQAVGDAFGISGVEERRRHCPGQTQLAIHLPQKHQAAIGTEGATCKWLRSPDVRDAQNPSHLRYTLASAQPPHKIFSHADFMRVSGLCRPHVDEISGLIVQLLL
jgi:hypothetical protein